MGAGETSQGWARQWRITDIEVEWPKRVQESGRTASPRAIAQERCHKSFTAALNGAFACLHADKKTLDDHTA